MLIKVVLAKAFWCPHCIDFVPIYKNAEKLATQNSFFYDKNKDVEFYMYDVANDADKQKMDLEHPGLSPNVQGYPTVFILLFDGTKRVGVGVVEHTRQENGEDINAASQHFLTNIIDKYNSITKTNQAGGSIYYKKYMKYKTKYEQLKNNNKYK